MDHVEFHTVELSVGGVVLFNLLPLPPPEEEQQKKKLPILRTPNEIKETVKEILLTVTMGNNLPNVDPEIDKTFDKLTITWTDDVTLTIVYTQSETGNRYDIEWYVRVQANKESKRVFRDIVGMTGYWYGGAVMSEQRWPLEWKKQSTVPYITGDARSGRYGGILERYWLSSKGVGLLVHDDCPLSVGIDDKERMILESKWQAPYTDTKNVGLSLKYSIFQSENVQRVHTMVVSHFPKPRDIPDEACLRLPTWSTQMMDRATFDQDQVVTLARKLKDFRFPVSQLQVDDAWMSAQGDFTFNKKLFPDPRNMIDTLEKIGVRLNLTVHPHCSPFSEVAKEKVYWLGSKAFVGYAPYWRGLGKMLDMSNIDAVRWFLKRLVSLRKEHKITSFKFDGGEAYWLPKWPLFKEPLSDPCEYTHSYAALAAAADTKVRAQQVRTAHRTQHLAVLVRMPDRSSTWGYNNGIKAVIPTALTLGILGYPFVLCDIINSGTYFHDKGPTKELYIRWMELAIFMPAIQFTHFPWNFDDETVMIARNLFQIRDRYADDIVTLAQEALSTGAPIIRPIWWIAPDDEVAHTIDSQFLVGNDMLVAPILEEGAKKRDIYLPHGRWRDMLRDETLIGGRWRKDYLVELHEIPHFVKVKVKLNIGHLFNHSVP